MFFVFLPVLSPPLSPEKGEEERALLREKEEKSLIARAAGGDEKAFALLVERYRSTVRRVLLSKTDRPDLVDDLSQEVFLKLWRSLSSFRGESRFFTWLYAVCSNTARDALRASAGKQVESLSSFDEEGEYEQQKAIPDSPESRPDEIALSGERKRLVRGAIDSLSPQMKEVVVLRDLEGYAYSEIASMLGLEEGTVKSRLNRARSSIKLYLEERNFFS